VCAVVHLRVYALNMNVEISYPLPAVRNKLLQNAQKILISRKLNVNSSVIKKKRKLKKCNKVRLAVGY